MFFYFEMLLRMGWLPDKFNDYTHGGVIQVKARNTKDEIIGSYSEEHITWLLMNSSNISLVASVEMANVTGNAEMANELYRAFKEIYGEA